MLDKVAASDSKTTLSYRQLWTNASQVARSLLARGSGTGDCVGLWAPNGSVGCTTSFGIYLAGAALVPLNTRFKSGRRPTSFGLPKRAW